MNTTFVQQQQNVSLQHNKARILNNALIKNNLFVKEGQNNDFPKRRASRMHPMTEQPAFPARGAGNTDSIQLHN